MLISQICKESDFETEWFANGCIKLQEPFRYQRKLWEWCYIYQTLFERDLLLPFMRGIGFGVGKEPLTAAFASLGCQVTATDLDFDRARSQGWVDSNQHAINQMDLNEKGICDQSQFKNLVKFEFADMNQISDVFTNQFDFTWSSCCFEHCGSIELGKQFIINQMKCLRPGGIAIHTTEFNLSSNEGTMDTGSVVLFRLRDIEWMVQMLRLQGHSVDIDYSVGNGHIESFVDVPPFFSTPYHLRLQLGQYVTTSIGLIIKKAG